MSDSDDGADPWEDRKRMRSDLRYKLNQLVDLFTVKGLSPVGFGTSHARQLARVLDLIHTAVSSGAADDRLDRLAAVGSTGVSSDDAMRHPPDVSHPKEVQLTEALRLVHAERDQLLEAKRIGEETVTELKRQLADAERRASANLAGEGTDSSHIDTPYQRIRDLEAEQKTRKKELDGLRKVYVDTSRALDQYQALASVTDVDAYVSIGSPGEIQERERQSAALVHTLVTQLDDAEKSNREYEAMLGPLLLGYDRRSRQLGSFYRAIAHLASLPTNRPLSQPLGVLLPSLHASKIRSTDPASALDHLTEIADPELDVQNDKDDGDGEVIEEPDAPGSRTVAQSLFSTNDADLVKSIRSVVANRPLASTATRSCLIDALTPEPGVDLYDLFISSHSPCTTAATPSASSGRSEPTRKANVSSGLHQQEIDLTSDTSLTGSPVKARRLKSSSKAATVGPKSPRRSPKRKTLSSGKERSMKVADLDHLRQRATK